MAYPLIILGAGASHDYSPLGTMAPLTKELIEERFLHSEFLDKYKGAGNLLVEIIHQIRKNRNRSFEEVLTEIDNNSDKSIEMQKHFIGLEFYLKDLFTGISEPNDSNRRVHQLNNYQAILNRIHTYSNGKALIATFNYDSLLENNLDNKPSIMSDYIVNDIKIIKLHGSHDWIYVRRNPDIGVDYSNIKDSYDLCIKYPKIFEEIKKSGPPLHIKQLENSRERNINAFPAITIPLIGKDKFVCPDQHIQIFENELSKIDRVLIVGWRAEDPLLLGKLKSKLQEMSYKVLVVSLELEEAQKIAEKVREGLGNINSGYLDARGGGFSGFIADEASKTFFA